MRTKKQIEDIKKSLKILYDFKEHLECVCGDLETMQKIEDNTKNYLQEGLKTYHSCYSNLQKEIEDLENEPGVDKQTLKEIQEKIKDLKLEHYSEEDVGIAYA